MISSEIFIVKRDEKKETSSLDKIKNAISKAVLSVGSFATQDLITNVLSRVSISAQNKRRGNPEPGGSRLDVRISPH